MRKTANRAIKDFCWGHYVGDFYRVKDAILRRYGKAVGYDIQHIQNNRLFINQTKIYHFKSRNEKE